MVGVNDQLNEATTLSLTFVNGVVRGATRNECQLLTLGATHQQTLRDTWSLSATLGSFTDRQDGSLDWDADLLRAEWTREL